MIVDQQAFDEAVAEIMQMDLAQLFTYLDSLYGRDELPRSSTPEDIRNEAIAQTERKFGPDYERFQLSNKRAFTSALVRKRNAEAQAETDADGENNRA